MLHGQTQISKRQTGQDTTNMVVLISAAAPPRATLPGGCTHVATASKPLL